MPRCDPSITDILQFSSHSSRQTPQPENREILNQIARRHEDLVLQRRSVGVNQRLQPQKQQERQSQLRVRIHGASKYLETENESVGETGCYQKGSNQIVFSSLNKLVIVMDGQQEKIARIIPHFERLLTHTQKLMPRYLYRVAHEHSGGKIFTDSQGTHFLSHFATVNEQSSLSDLSLYEHDTLADYLKIHVNGWRSMEKKAYDSHFISTTDSFEHVLTWAVRFQTMGLKEISIYAIDLWRASCPTLFINMAHAMKAWNLEASMANWRYRMLIHGGESEWIFLDHLVVQQVAKIDFKSFAYRKRGSLDLSLFNIAPQLRNKGVRSILQRRLYFTEEEKAEMDKFENQVWIRKIAPLPPTPRCVRADSRTQFDHHAANKLWNLVKDLDEPFKSIIFVYLASTMARTHYYHDSIVSEISSSFRSVIHSHLDRVKDMQTNLGKEVLVYYRPEAGNASRRDVDEYHNLIEDVITAWVNKYKEKEDAAWRDPPVFIVRGASRSLSNILGLEELGKQGRCEIVELSNANADFPGFSYAEVLGRGAHIQRDISDEEHAKYYTDTYNRVFHAIRH